MERQRTECDKKVMEVISAKKSHQEQEAELKYEIDRLKTQMQRVREDFSRAQEKNKRVSRNLQRPSGSYFYLRTSSPWSLTSVSFLPPTRSSPIQPPSRSWSRS